MCYQALPSLSAAGIRVHRDRSVGSPVVATVARRDFPHPSAHTQLWGLGRRQGNWIKVHPDMLPALQFSHLFAPFEAATEGWVRFSGDSQERFFEVVSGDARSAAQAAAQERAQLQLPRRAHCTLALLFAHLPGASLEQLADVAAAACAGEGGGGGGGGGEGEGGAPALLAACLDQLPAQLRYAWADTLLQEVHSRLRLRLGQVGHALREPLASPARPSSSIGVARPAGLGRDAQQSLRALRALWGGGGALGALLRGSRDSMRSVRDAALACAGCARAGWEELGGAGQGAAAEAEAEAEEEEVGEQCLPLAAAAAAAQRSAQGAAPGAEEERVSEFWI